MLARDRDAALAIINAAARAYRGVIPADRWHDPYMPRDELEAEIANGILFRVVEEDGLLSAVMGIPDSTASGVKTDSSTAWNASNHGSTKPPSDGVSRMPR